ncbi:MAG: GTPase [Bacillota bacterium]|jgi:ribosome biogenesis GTPase A
MDKHTGLRCSGCGVQLHSDPTEERGFVPAHVLQQASPEILCRRCFRIRHYGKAEPVRLTIQTVLDAVSRGAAAARAVFYIVDPFDFEGTWHPEWLPLFGKRPYYILVNKIDLLPQISKADEIIAWIRQRVKGTVPAPAGIVACGTVRSRDLAAVNRLIQDEGLESIALVGATNVGKSSLLRALVGTAQAKGQSASTSARASAPASIRTSSSVSTTAPASAPVPLVSHFPGTTQYTVTVTGKDGVKWIDTPGIAPGDRLSDLVCPDCGAQLAFAGKKLKARLYHLDPGQAVVFAGLAAFTNKASETRTLLCYAGETVVMHRTSAEKAADYLQNPPDWLAIPCAACHAKLAAPVTRKYQIKNGEDLAIAGLGWVSLRGGDALLEQTCPDGVLVSKRPGLFGRKPAK